MSTKYKILSWDVGIKNLAYCLLEKDTQNNGTFKVLKWDKINIIDSDLVLCCGLKKNNDVCGKKASFVGNSNSIIKYYCGAHKSQYTPLDEDWEETFMVQISDDDDVSDGCTYVLPKKGTRCNKSCHFKSNDNFYCNAHSKHVKDKVEKDAQIQKIKRKKATATNPEELCEKMYSKLDAIPDIRNVDEVLIENQPSLKNPSMKTVSCLLFSYFVTRGKIDNKTINKIRFISPSNKLKVNDNQIQEILNKIGDTDRIYTIVIKLLKKYLGLTQDDEQLDLYISKNDRLNTVHLILRYLMNKKNTLDKLGSYGIFKKIKITTDKFTELVKKIEKDDNNYDITKLLAIKYTQVLMSVHGKTWLTHFDTYTKKDDLCDALLQGYYNLFI